MVVLSSQFSFADRCLAAADLALRTVLAPAHSQRAAPTAQESAAGAVLSEAEKKQVVALMRVDHAGEICAQALYSGQALATQDAALQAHLARAGQEEVDHLAWTEQRLRELGARPSVLNAFWYAGAFAIGFGAAKLGDDWSLGFVAETEAQVGAHLQGHLDALPVHDARSRAILAQMQAEEVAHRDEALARGARELPEPIKLGMRWAAKVMTATAARI